MQAKRVMAGLLLVCFLITGCRAAGPAGGETAPEGASAAATAEEASAAETADPADPVIENISNNQEGHYSFQPHVFGSRYLEQFGEETRDAFFAYCDALREGRDTFPCPDQNTLDWCVGRLSHFFFPVASQNVTAGVCEDGTAGIVYLIPPEEFVQKQKDFEEQITGILNDCLGDDYNDLEKILALYEYMTTRYTYDYEMYEHALEWMDLQSPYRCLTEKTGICNEIASLYNYLLLQVGIDSEEMGGHYVLSDGISESHSWVYVTLDGEFYHIDPTYGLTTDRPPLAYFMMTDAIREDRDWFGRETYTLAARGDETRDYFTFEAVSDKYSPLWEGDYMGMDRGSREIVYRDLEGDLHRFSYDGQN